MAKGKVGGSGDVSKNQFIDELPVEDNAKGRDSRFRKVTKKNGKKLLDSNSSVGNRWLSRRSVKYSEPVITPYHQKMGYDRDGVEPSLNSRPFYDFWQVQDGPRDFTSTVDHQMMEVKNVDDSPAPTDGVWHVKSPGKESRQTRFKRFLQKIIYHITGQDYKGHYYDDHKLLVQKEVLATNLYRAVVLEDEHPDEAFEQKFQCGYSYDEENDRHCVAIRHLDGFKDAGTLFHRNAEWAEFRIFDERHNPAADLVIRRFFLGDEDYLKLDNYMYKTNTDTEGRTRMYCIDFGMSFYNQFNLPECCNSEQFKKRLLKKSRKHQVQYAGKPTMMTVLESMTDRQVETGIKSALEKISRLDDGFLERQCRQVHNKEAREALLAVLKFKRQQARSILDSSESWPDEPGRDVSDGLVAHPARRS